MTEADWLAATDPYTMLNWVRVGRRARKAHLCAVAICGRIVNLLTKAGKDALIAAEQYADGQIDHRELQRASVAVGHPKGYARRCAAAAARAASYWSSDDYVGLATRYVLQALIAHGTPGDTDQVTQIHLAVQVGLVRDIFGNPFRPVAVESAWRTANVIGLARAIYEECAFERLPILADALIDAGCTNQDILSHCRSGGPHARGCWVVDLLLGKC